MYLDAKPPKLFSKPVSSCIKRHGEIIGVDVLNLVKHDAGGLIDAKQAHKGAQDRDPEQNLVVGPRKEENVVILDALG